MRLRAEVLVVNTYTLAERVLLFGCLGFKELIATIYVDLLKLLR